VSSFGRNDGSSVVGKGWTTARAKAEARAKTAARAKTEATALWRLVEFLHPTHRKVRDGWAPGLFRLAEERQKTEADPSFDFAQAGSSGMTTKKAKDKGNGN
jgi:hypothetical protein